MSTEHETAKQLYEGLEQIIDRVDGKPRLKSCFVIVNQEHDIGVGVSDVADHLKGLIDPPPASLLAALDLPTGSSFADVAAAVKVLMDAPIVETPEEKAEIERGAAVMGFLLDGGTSGRA
jgi:hypothetical protein